MKSKWMSFKKLKKIVKKVGIKSQSQWYKWVRTQKDYNNIPCAVVYVYGDEWVSWYDFIGKKPKNFLSYSEVVSLMKKLKIRSEFQYHQLDRDFYNLPHNPEDTYKKQWKNWSDFLGKDIRDKGRKYFLDHDYFKKWSHDTSYILGLIFADGYIGARHVGITLHDSDSYLLRKVLKKISYNGKLSFDKKRNSCVMAIHSLALVNDILGIFGEKKKSFRTFCPKIPREYFPDFLRGLWDGDGSVWCDKEGKNYRASLTSSHNGFLRQIYSILQKEIGVSGTISKTVQPKGTVVVGHILKKDSIVYRLRLCPNNVRRLRDYIYSTPSNLKMMRKYKKFQKAGEMYTLRD